MTAFTKAGFGILLCWIVLIKKPLLLASRSWEELLTSLTFCCLSSCAFYLLLLHIYIVIEFWTVLSHYSICRTLVSIMGLPALVTGLLLLTSFLSVLKFPTFFAGFCLFVLFLPLLWCGSVVLSVVVYFYVRMAVLSISHKQLEFYHELFERLTILLCTGFESFSESFVFEGFPISFKTIIVCLKIVFFLCFCNLPSGEIFFFLSFRPTTFSARSSLLSVMDK